jgi:hypothetical protein
MENRVGFALVDSVWEAGALIVRSVGIGLFELKVRSRQVHVAGLLTPKHVAVTDVQRHSKH